MTDAFRRSPIFDLRDWWLSNSRMKEIFKVEERGYPPFFPIQQQPESEPPYVVYDFKKTTGAEAWFFHCDVFIMEITAIDFQDAYEAVNIMIDMANKGAISARDLSLWIRSEGRREDFQIHSIEFDGAGKVDPAEEQSGEIKVPVSFSIEYSPLTGNYIS